MKYCLDCEKTKSDDEFNTNKQNNDGLSSYCNECCNIRGKKRRKILRKQWRTFINAILPPVCSSCGYDKSPRAIDYHHINPAEKSLSISHYANNRGLTKKNKQLMSDELDKCICLCSNCHRELHDNDYED